MLSQESMVGEDIVGQREKKKNTSNSDVLHRDMQVVRAQSGARGIIIEHNPKIEGT